MFIQTQAIQNGSFADEYGKKGKQFKGSMPSYSFGFEIIDFPRGTESFSFVFDDPDSVPVCGFTWVHWLGANMCQAKIEDNESIHTTTFFQGKNSWGESLYGGMAPPDKEHNYHLRVFALDCLLNLKNGFSLDELNKQMAGHILDSSDIWGHYSP